MAVRRRGREATCRKVTRRAAPPCRHPDTVAVFSTPRPPRLGSARRLLTSPRARYPLPPDERGPAGRAAAGVARDLLGSPTDGGSGAPAAVPPPGRACGTVGQPGGRGRPHGSTSTV